MLPVRAQFPQTLTTEAYIFNGFFSWVYMFCKELEEEKEEVCPEEEE